MPAPEEEGIVGSRSRRLHRCSCCSCGQTDGESASKVSAQETGTAETVTAETVTAGMVTAEMVTAGMVTAGT